MAVRLLRVGGFYHSSSSFRMWRAYGLVLLTAILSLAFGDDDLVPLLNSDCTDQPCEVQSDELRFFIIGDWGGINLFPHYTRAQVDIAAQMDRLGTEKETHFVVSVGDNFYTGGVQDVDDPRFKSTFEEVFYQAPTQKPWYISAGNHDHYGNVSAQIAYTKKSNRWKFPHNFYRFDYVLTPDNTKVTFIVTDTILLCGNTKPQIGSQPEGPDDPYEAERQWRFIEKQLEMSESSAYIVVIGHYPTFSIGEHGPTACLVNRLHEMLHKYKVNLYLSGHDHNIQHLKIQHGSYEWSVNHVLSGGGAYMNTQQNHVADVPAGASKYFFPTGLFNQLTGSLGVNPGAFAYAELGHAEGQIIFLAGGGQELYRFPVERRTTANVVRSVETELAPENSESSTEAPPPEDQVEAPAEGEADS